MYFWKVIFELAKTKHSSQYQGEVILTPNVPLRSSTRHRIPDKRLPPEIKRTSCGSWHHAMQNDCDLRTVSKLRATDGVEDLPAYVLSTPRLVRFDDIEAVHGP